MRVMMKLYLFAPIAKHVFASQCKVVVFIW